MQAIGGIVNSLVKGGNIGYINKIFMQHIIHRLIKVRYY